MVELWIFHRPYQTNLCSNGGEFLLSAIWSANASALFINNEEVLAVNIKKAQGSHPHKSHALNKESFHYFSQLSIFRMLKLIEIMFYSQLVLTACFINVWYSTFYWPRPDPYTVLRHGRAFNFYHRHYRADGRLLYCPTFSDKSGIINQISGDS